MSEKNNCHHEHDHTESCACSGACNHHHVNDEADFRRKAIITGVALLLIFISVVIEHLFSDGAILAVILAIAVLVLTAYPIFRGAYHGLREKERNVNELVSLAIIGAVILGEFVVAAEVAVIITIGEFIEVWAYNRSRRDIESIVSNNPRYGHRIRDESEVHGRDTKQVEEISIDEIAIGDKLLIRPGDVAPVDGIVLEGSSFFDESCLTGESVPQEKNSGDLVYSGSINYDGTVITSATTQAENSTYAEIVSLVREAGERRPPARLFIDQFARVYTPAILLISVVILLVTKDPIRAITVLIVACPCALLFATPSVVLTAIGSAAKNGILIKSGEILEICSSISVVLFDKTGTFTSGEMRVVNLCPMLGVSERELLCAAGEAEATSSHPIAQAILRACHDAGEEIISSAEHVMYPGLGVQAQSRGSIIYAGSAAFLEKNGISSLPDRDTARSDGIEIWIARDKNVLGTVWISDTLRPESEKTVHAIRNLGIEKVGMVSGDGSSSVSIIAQKAGLSDTFIRFGMLPEEKRQFIEDLQQSKGPDKKEKEVVCFIGDGTNDGPALAQADIGVSIASRTDTVALKAAHVILMRDGISQLPVFLDLGIRSGKTITMNVVLALGINVFTIILAAYGLLSPTLGAVFHQLGMVAVVLNSARLAMRIKKDNRFKQAG